MTYTKKKFIFFIFLSLGLHSIVLAFIYNLSNSFVSSESSIVEVKFEKFSEEMHSKQSKPFKNKTKSNKTNSEQNNATIPSKKIEIKKKPQLESVSLKKIKKKTR